MFQVFADESNDSKKERIYVVVDFLSEHAYKLDPQENVAFTFDRSPDRQYNGGRVFEYLTNQVEWKCQQNLVPNVEFASREDVRIQAADLWARELMKRFDTAL